ncbi:MAG: hypothetical protein KGO53_09370 [Alphaproteobacteria bacterium]|nr:hypothetical protein [Alphaproteobacteria bacterium]
MTSLNPATRRDAAALTRADVGLFVLAGFVIASLKDVSARDGLLAFLDGLARQNLFFCFAVYVAGWRLLRSPARAASGFDIGLLIIAALLFALAAYLGQPLAAGLVLTVLVLAFATQRPEPEFRSALIVMGAMAVNCFWGPLMFQTFTDQIIGIDVTALRMINAVLRPDITSNGATFRTGEGFSIIVIGACSVFNSASVAVLAATAISQRLKTWMGKRDIAAMAAVLLVMLAMNSGRLAILGWSRDNYLFWHNGPGVVWFGLGETAVIAIVATLCARWAARA